MTSIHDGIEHAAMKHNVVERANRDFVRVDDADYRYQVYGMAPHKRPSDFLLFKQVRR